jgi:protein-ribulosamine 3-kinase
VIWDALGRHIGEATGQPFSVRTRSTVGGGCINSAETIGDGTRGYFVKTNRAACIALFESESDGLAALAATATLRVPRPICRGVDGDTAYLVLELLDLGGRADGARAGRALADLHRAGAGNRSHGFGWHRDNFIGATPQSNTPDTDWVRFWRERRLAPQLAVAATNGQSRGIERSGERLLAGLDALIGHRPPPSLLHGDLWGGNLGYLPGGEPAIYDPAVYYGDREADLAMTELFGGFGPDFYAAYRESWPLDPGYAIRRQLYNLYHILNHLNLFGGGYLAQARNLIDRLLAEIR